MKRNFVKILILITVLIVSVVMLTACNKGTDNKYTVSFNLNYTGAPQIGSAKVASGSTATAPAAPTREHYAFGGWYKEAALENEFDFATEKITKDTALFAKWIQNYYYIAGNFTGYEPKLEGFNLLEVPGKDGWYYITVNLIEAERDATYDGHYYKITNGTWDPTGCWGTDNYGFKPAPASPTGGGLGSIWIHGNCSLTVYFDSVNKIIYDNYEQTFEMPRIYGDFNTAMKRGTDWSIWNDGALTLSDADKDGIFTGLYKIPKYTGTSENGYSMAVATKAKYDTQWFVYGVTEQFKFDGTAAGMGGVSYLKPDKDTIYEFSYDSVTHKTTAVPYEANQVVNFANPIIYGDFGNWSIEGNSAIKLTDPDGDGTFVGFKKLSKYTGTEEKGYMLATALSKKLYDDQYGIRWGAETQYKFDGTAAGMGGVSYLKPDKDTIYEFSYNGATHVTTVTALEAGDIKNLAGPTVYGDFTGWVYEGGKAFVLADPDENGIFTGTITLDAYTGEGEGYMAAVAITKKLYDDQYGIRWGTEEQYKFDGTAAGMGGVSYLKPTAQTTYLFSYDSATHKTTVTIPD